VPERYSDEHRARNDLERLAKDGRWPLLITPLDTSGEKPFEEFIGLGESAADIGLRNVTAVRHVPCSEATQVLIDSVAKWVNEPNFTIDKEAFVEAISAAVLNFHHAGSDRNLDQRL
jgi:hypothetical protein